MHIHMLVVEAEDLCYYFLLYGSCIVIKLTYLQEVSLYIGKKLGISSHLGAKVLAAFHSELSFQENLLSK